MFDFGRRHPVGGSVFHKNMIRRCALTCALLFAMSMAGKSALPVSADVLTSDSIRQKEASIAASRQERESIQNSLSDIQKMKEELESSKANLVSYVTELDAKVTQLQENIDRLTQQIEEKEEEIVQTQAELEEAEAKKAEQYKSMKIRLRFIYEKGNSRYFETIINTWNFAELLNKATYIEMLSDYDDRLLKEFTQQAELVRKIGEALEEEKKTLDEAKAGVEAERQSMEALIDEKRSQISVLSSEISETEESIQEYQAKVAAQDNAIAALEAQVAAEKAALAAQNRRHYGGGQFVWPAPSYSYISSEFGNRIHPIYGTTRFHSGLDMASAYGTPILAAADGVVVAASYDPSMGNYVMIDHGDSLYTIYMHCSSLYVSKGQEVSAGANIATVGSTGASTGPHLHFSVRLNGSYVNPWNYL